MTGISVSSRRNAVPSYLLHKPSGQARCRIDGRDFYLGVYGTTESRQRYADLITKHATGQSVEPSSTPEQGEPTSPTVNELALAFYRHAEQHYRKDGQVTSELHCYKMVIGPLVELFGYQSVDDIRPSTLKTLQLALIDKRWVRKSINRAIGRVRHIFKWGVENDMVKLCTWQALQTVSPLLAGRTAAKDNPARQSVPDADIEAVRGEVSELVRDLIDLQRLTGARSGELLGLTTGMIDRSGDIWTAALSDHKTVHHGQSRVLVFGPKSQLILARYLTAKPGQKLFSITRPAYCRAVTRACDRLEITRWVPHQLRHTAGDTIRQTFGLEHAQATLGHSKASMTERYAHAALSKAAEVALRIG